MRHFAASLLLLCVTVTFGQFSPDPSQWYRLIFAHSGQCMRPTAAKTGNCVQIEQSVFNSNDTSQLWRFSASSAAPGYWYVVNKNGKVLTVNGDTSRSKVVSWTPYKGENQFLSFNESPFKGYYFIADLRSIKKGTGLVFDMTNESTTPGGKVQISAKKACGFHNQVVRIQAVSTMDHLVFWNTLGSSSEITHSIIGLDGIFKGGSFVSGKFGKAYQVTVAQDTLVSFPESILSADSGCVEFWAKLSGYSGQILELGAPQFIQTPVVGIQFNGNDGAGNGGLCGYFDNVSTDNATGTGPFTTDFTYEQLLGNVTAWHHYALVWNNKGIKSIGLVPVSTIPYQDEDKTMQLCRVAVYLDGVLHSAEWKDHGGNLNTPSTSRKLYLSVNQYKDRTGTVTIDNMKVWNYTKVNFSDRFVE